MIRAEYAGPKPVVKTWNKIQKIIDNICVIVKIPYDKCKIIVHLRVILSCNIKRYI